MSCERRARSVFSTLQVCFPENRFVRPDDSRQKERSACLYRAWFENRYYCVTRTRPALKHDARVAAIDGISLLSEKDVAPFDVCRQRHVHMFIYILLSSFKICRHRWEGVVSVLPYARVFPGVVRSTLYSTTTTFLQFSHVASHQLPWINSIAHACGMIHPPSNVIIGLYEYISDALEWDVYFSLSCPS